MFKEEWAQGIDSMGVYFGGGKQAQIKFICSGLNEKANSKGVCECVSGYERINGVCVPNPCANFIATECIKTCTSSNGVATYTYGTVCSNGYFCNANHQCENPCYDVECQTCTPKNGQPRWTDKANQTSCSTGWCQGGDCVSACTDKTWHQECQECNVHTGAITNKTGNCTNGICQGGSCVPTPVTPTNKCTGVTCDPCNSCDTTDGQCKPNNTLTCTNGTCNNGTCTPNVTNKCANVTCNPCNSCDTTDGQCKPNNTLTCTNGTCQNGTCVPNGGSGTGTCSENNLSACDAAECVELEHKLSSFSRVFYHTVSHGCAEWTETLCHPKECVPGETFKIPADPWDYSADVSPLEGLNNYRCAPCDADGPIMTSQEACESCGEQRRFVEVDGALMLDGFIVKPGWCVGPSPTCGSNEIFWGEMCWPCDSLTLWGGTFALTDVPLKDACDRCPNREVVTDPFYNVMGGDIVYNSQGPVCRLKECPSGTARVGSDCYSCDDPHAWGFDDIEYRVSVYRQACDLCTNREFVKIGDEVEGYMYGCQLKTCPENWIRSSAGDCVPCHANVIAIPVAPTMDSSSSCTCTNREVTASMGGLIFNCTLKSCIDE